MFGHKKKLAQKKYKEFLYLDGLAIKASIFLDRAEVEPEMKFVAVGLKYAMEKFADEFGKGEQMYDIYKQYPKLKWLEMQYLPRLRLEKF